MTNIDGTFHGYAIVSWMNDNPEAKDITGHGQFQDVPFESIDEAKNYLYDHGFVPDLGLATAVVAALVEVAVVD